MLLEVRALDVTYGTTRAVRGLDLTVETGEIVTVLGANGAGKSSLLRAVQGLVRPASGSILFNGEPVAGSSAANRVSRGLVLVPEGRQIFTSLTVHDNLLMGAYSRRDDPSREIDQIYQRFPNLARRRDMFASVLSGGEQQMLAIARGLASSPKLLVIDELSLGLAPRVLEMLFPVLESLNRGGLAILLVEQLATQALAVSHRAYVMETGKVTLSGRSGDLARDPAVRQAYLGRA